MATLDDKLLGEKLHNYCSSSEDEGESDDEKSGDEEGNDGNDAPAATALPEPKPWGGTASNTGPKGVLEDWRRFKKLEAENRKEMEVERLALAKKLTLQARTECEDAEAKEQEEIEDELNELLDEDFLQKYQKQRMAELRSQLNRGKVFGKVISLSSQDEFLAAIDKESEHVIVVVHIYNTSVVACETMDGCLSILAADYPNIKFCRIAADIAGLSRNFHLEGPPALLVYKGGNIIGNFVKLSAEFGNDFFAKDVERFLIEYGLLPEK